MIAKSNATSASAQTAQWESSDMKSPSSRSQLPAPSSQLQVLSSKLLALSSLVLAGALVRPLHAFPWDGRQPQGFDPKPPPYESTITTVRQSPFFSYPTWWTRGAGSSDTPGSCDWYVPGVTGLTYAVGFDVAVNGTVNTNLVMAPMEGMFPDDEGFYNWHFPLVDGDDYAPESDTRLHVKSTAPIGAQWFGQHEERVGTNVVLVANTYTATASQFMNATWYTGFWQGRAARLTPQVLAGVNSTFEGLYERMYYASQYGGTNWTVSAMNGWGGTTPATFRLDGAADTNDLDRSHLQDYHCPTDGRKRTMPRKLFTRRLTELENILRFTGEADAYRFRQMCGTNCPPSGSGVAGVIGGVFDRSRNRDFRVQRPTWPDVWVWSTSMFDDLDGEQEIPSVAWTENPWEAGGGDDIWLKCCRPLRALAGVSSRGVTNYVHEFNWPIGNAFSAIGYGEDFWFRDKRRGRMVYDSTNAVIRHTFDSMLTNFYPSVCTTNGETFATRRLQFDDLARANQRLSALDRTIMEDQVAHTNHYLGLTWHTEMSVTGKVELTGGEYGFDFQPATWMGSEVDEFMYTNANYLTEGGNRIGYSVSCPGGAGVQLASAAPDGGDTAVVELYMAGTSDVIGWAKMYGPVHFTALAPSLWWPIVAVLLAENDPSQRYIEVAATTAGGDDPLHCTYTIPVVCVASKSVDTLSVMPRGVGDFRLKNSLQPLRQELLDKIGSSTVSTFMSGKTRHRTGILGPGASNIAYRVSSSLFYQPDDLRERVWQDVRSAYTRIREDALDFTGWDGESAPKIAQSDLERGLSDQLLWTIDSWDIIPTWEESPLVSGCVINTNGEVEVRFKDGHVVTQPWPFRCGRLKLHVVVPSALPPADPYPDKYAEGEARYYDVERVDWDWDAVRRDKK